MESALVVTSTEKSVEFFAEMLKAISCGKITNVSTCGQARRQAVNRDFDLCIINAPLSDESGESLSVSIAARGACQVMLIVKSEYYEEVSAHVEDHGVITVAKPLNRALFWNALKLAKAAQKKVRMLQNENTKLIQRIEDIRVIGRAKLLLISHLAMTEPEAHRYIEKQAMDMRKPKRAIAEGILKTYES
jgi:response regulator NasT